MSTGGYENVPEFKQLSSDAPLGTITAWTPKNAVDSNENIDLPDGWLPCDGHAIENGPWAGGATPNLNTNSHFLRGGNLDNVMEFEEDQIHDHEHTDAGHFHSSPPHFHPYHDWSVSGNGNFDDDHFDYDDHGGDYTLYNQDTSRSTDGIIVKIESAESNIGGVSSSYKSGAETRPRNMKVVWVMKCW